MVQQTAKDPADYTLPLYMNGLSGRMLRMPGSARKKREILLIPGVHTSLERMQSFAEYLNRFGAVTLPDLPGFGGMQPFYKIGEKPTLDNQADYLAAFIKLRYKNRRFTIVAQSFGFALVTRMLQKYPEIAKKVDLLISLVGFVHKDDFRWKKRNIFFMKSGSWFFARSIPGTFAKYVLLWPPFIRMTYSLVEDRHPKFKDFPKEDRAERVEFEVGLWQSNDIRTYMQSAVTMFTLDLCNKHVDLPVYHVAVTNDHYFDNLLVEQHMRRIYKDFTQVNTKMPHHVPTVIATAKEVEIFVPPKIRELLRKKV
jgi:pimeloyl-ACP methyl ester carboxylesterase